MQNLRDSVHVCSSSAQFTFQTTNEAEKTAVSIGEKIDRIARVVFPSTFMAFVVLYFIWYLVIVDSEAESINMKVNFDLLSN